MLGCLVFLLPGGVACQVDAAGGFTTGLPPTNTNEGSTTEGSTSVLTTTITGGSAEGEGSGSSSDSGETTESSTSASSTDGGSSSSTGCAPGSLACACDDEACGEGLVCLEGLCAVLECGLDVFEPSESEADATVLGEIDDADGSGSMFTGVLAGPTDVDWYRYVGDDDIFAVVNPTRDVQADGALRICKFAECLNGLPNTEVACPGGTTPTLSPAGRPGCCSGSGFELSDINCAGVIEDSMHVFIRVDQPGQTCVGYTINFHF